DLPEPLLGRPGNMAAPTLVCGNIIHHPAGRRDLCTIADRYVVVESGSRSDRHVVTDRQAAREPDLGREQAMPADGHIVADLDLIVDFGAVAYDRVAQAATVDGGAGANLDIVLDQHTAGLRHLQMPFWAEENEAVAVLADAAAGMDQHVISDQRY